MKLPQRSNQTFILLSSRSERRGRSRSDQVLILWESRSWSLCIGLIQEVTRASFPIHSDATNWKTQRQSIKALKNKSTLQGTILFCGHEENLHLFPYERTLTWGGEERRENKSNARCGPAGNFLRYDIMHTSLETGYYKRNSGNFFHTQHHPPLPIMPIK